MYLSQLTHTVSEFQGMDRALDSDSYSTRAAITGSIRATAGAELRSASAHCCLLSSSSSSSALFLGFSIGSMWVGAPLATTGCLSVSLSLAGTLGRSSTSSTEFSFGAGLLADSRTSLTLKGDSSTVSLSICLSISLSLYLSISLSHSMLTRSTAPDSTGFQYYTSLPYRDSS